MSFRVERRLRGLTGHLWTAQGLVASRRRELLLSPDLGRSWRELGTLPGQAVDGLTRLRLAERLLHRSIGLVHPCAGGGLAVAGSVLYRGTGRRFAPVRRLRELCPMHRGAATLDGVHYLAEYGRNPEARAVRILRSDDDGRSWYCAHAFARGEVRHVHAVQADPHVPGRLWVLTGDDDAACRILYSDDGLETLHRFAAGSQQCRAVSLLFEPEHLVWGMDSPRTPSYIVRASRATGVQRRVHRVGAPLYYGATNRAGQRFLGSTLEPGPGVEATRAQLLGSRDGTTWTELLRFARGLLPQHGILYLASGVAPGGWVAVSGRGLRRIDGELWLCRWREGA